MVFTMIGGGAHRLLATVRSAIREGAFREGGELRYYDLDASRSEAMAKMIQKSPEYRKNPAPIGVKWDLTLEQALEGADVVSVTLLAGGSYTMELGNELGWSYGFFGSDNVSIPGAFLALRGAPILMNVARTMERVCPGAILLDFANPVAVLSAMVNMYTKIRCYGICEGHMNHGYDLTRILTGKDEYCPDYDVYVAGINHASFIVRGTLHGEDLFELMRRRFDEVPNWAELLVLSPYWTEPRCESMRNGLRQIEYLFRHRNVLLFSNENDGVGHYFYEDEIKKRGKPFGHDGELLDAEGMAALKARADAGRANRAAANVEFAKFAAMEPDDIPWTDPARPIFKVLSKGDVQCKVLCGLSGVENTRIAVSDLNDGSVSNMAKGLTLEFSHEVDRSGIHPIGGLEVPEGVYGMTASLAAHQTLLARACATEDPHDLYTALLAYPVDSATDAARELCKKLLIASDGMIAPSFKGLRDYL